MKENGSGYMSYEGEILSDATTGVFLNGTFIEIDIRALQMIHTFKRQPEFSNY